MRGGRGWLTWKDNVRSAVVTVETCGRGREKKEEAEKRKRLVVAPGGRLMIGLATCGGAGGGQAGGEDGQRLGQHIEREGACFLPTLDPSFLMFKP